MAMANVARFLVFCLAIALPLRLADARAGAIHQLALAPPLDPLSPVYELTSATFNDTLAGAPAPWALVEFYAHWCGACKHYKPHYERVAKLFNGPGAVHPGEVYLARVDCANNINQDVCTRFGVQYYPTLLWASPPTIARGDRGEKTEELEEIKNAYSADKLLAWINGRISKAYSLSDVAAVDAAGVVNTPIREIVQLEKMAATVYDTEEATATAFKIIIDEKLLRWETRGPLIRYLQLLVAHHPSRRCRKGSAGLLVDLADVWSEGEPPMDALSKYNVCGKSSPSNYWVSCRGDNRGYNCGTWLLFHSLSVRVSDSESTEAFLAIRGFVDHFFKCKECREHFLDMSSSVVNTTKTQRDLVMWLWQAHNEVNKRLAKEDLKAGKADSQSPRTVWPTKPLCSDCFVGTNVLDPEWNHDAVYKFLTNWYGPSLQRPTLAEAEIVSGGSSLVKWASIGILLAGSGFLLVAWWWSKQTKTRKRLHKL